jgi:hypothetical protein
MTEFKIDDGVPVVNATTKYPWGAMMDLRDYFAGQALTALLGVMHKKYRSHEMARMAYIAADAMLAARKRKGE